MSFFLLKPSLLCYKRPTSRQTVKAFLNDMMESNKGHIVNIASMAGWLGCNNLVDYCSSKFAAVGFDEGLKLELKVKEAREEGGGPQRGGEGGG